MNHSRISSHSLVAIAALIVMAFAIPVSAAAATPPAPGRSVEGGPPSNHTTNDIRAPRSFASLTMKVNSGKDSTGAGPASRPPQPLQTVQIPLPPRAGGPASAFAPSAASGGIASGCASLSVTGCAIVQGARFCGPAAQALCRPS